MPALALLLPLVAAPQVDLTLAPAVQCAPANTVVEVELVLSAAAPTQVAGLDAILGWDPAALELVEAVPAPGLWFLSGFLTDPDGINADLTDGDALFTALGNPALPPTVGAPLTAVTFRFRVLSDGEVALLPALGVFGSTEVVGTTPGQDLTGALSAPAVLGVATPTAALEVVRVGVPPNPDALRPGATSGPVVGATWDPFVDHGSFLPAALLDGVGITLGPANVPLAGLGTLLCAPPLVIGPKLRPPGVPFSFPIPADCAFVGLSLCAQGFSISPLGVVVLTNALDFTVGTF